MNTEILQMIIFVACGVAFTLIYQKIFRDYKRTSARLQPITISSNPDTNLAIWQAIYQQAVETSRDTARALAGSNVAGLALSGAVMAASNYFPVINHGALIISIFSFGLGLIFSLMPIAGIAEQLRDHLSDHMQAMQNTGAGTTTLNHPWPTGLRHLVSSATLVILAIALAALFIAIMPVLIQWSRTL